MQTALPSWADLLPEVRLDVRSSGARSATYELADVDFLIGGLPGCDLRTGADAPGLVCLLAKHPSGVTLRKLATTQTINVNGQSVQARDLEHGDRIKIGGLELTVHIAPARATPMPPDLADAKRGLQQQIEQFRQQVVQFQNEKSVFERDAQTPKADALERERLLEERGLEIDRQQAELGKVRQEMADLRKQLYDHYQDRRDQLATLEEDLSKSKRALDEREKKLRLEEDDAADRRQRDRKRLEEIEKREEDLRQCTQRLEEAHQKFKEADQRREDEWARRNAELEVRERTVADQTTVLEANTKRYETDLVRLTRMEGSLEEREAELEKRNAELDKRRDDQQRDTAELQDQLVQIEEWRVKLTEQAEQLAKQKADQDQRERELAERGAALEGQQSTLTVLRSRLERMRDELRTREQQLDEQRERHDARNAEMTLKEHEFDQRQLALNADLQQHENDRRVWTERSAVMETAVRQLKDAQDQLAAAEERQRRESQQLDLRRRQLDESESILQGRLSQLADAQNRLETERQALRDRGVHLVQREEACATLQEQLHRRSEEIAARHQQITDQLQEYQTKFNELEERRRQVDERDQELTRQTESLRSEVEKKAAAIEQRYLEIAGFDERYQEQMNQLAVQRKTQADERAQFQLEQQTTLGKLADARAELETLRRETLEMVQQLPDAELRAGAAVERLADARTQLRTHLGEIHDYVRQCQDEMTQLRGKLQGDLDKLLEQEEVLRKGQDEHRLAMASFKQQLIAWQGQIADLKRLLTRDESRLERRQAQAAERAKEIESEQQRLVQHAEQLVLQEQSVAERRGEVDRHLADMREWYRVKLREVAGIPLVPSPPESQKPPSLSLNDETDDDAIVPIHRNILSITNAADPGDQKLGQTLRDTQLIDADTLTALLAEARRQRRSLRQVLLASGVITLYQLALIEAGNVQGLMLGPVRILDRIRQTAHETIYHVFDPRRGVEGVLRHLAESEMSDAVRPDEFRQRFAQAMLNEPNLANTLEVLELSGRPAALQEWLAGLPATDWPPLAAAPGVCYRLLTQAAQGLAAAHRAGVLHGHLSDAMMLLTADGVLKIRGLGEPPWLIGLAPDEEPSVREDLRVLGRIVSGWCTAPSVRKGAKTKPLPEALVSILYRLAADGEPGYQDAQQLLADLEAAAGAIPPNTEAWDRLVKYVREHGAAEATLRQSA